MSTAFASLLGVWSELRAGHQPLPTVTAIPPERCRPAAAAGSPITRDEMYFTIRINEMHLADNRQWFTVYDPLVVVVAEFNHGGERIVVPSVIGPNLIRKQDAADQPRHGVVLFDTRVTGPHPYRGGDVDLSVAFYQVRRTDHVRSLLKVVDGLSAALCGPGELPLMAKAGGALLAGVEGLLGLEETVYLAGHRISLANTPLDPFTTGFSALVAPPAPDDLSALGVRDRRLCIAAGDAGDRPYRQSDFVLLSISASEARGDDNLLPFHRLKTEGLAALWDGEDGLKRGKANLIAAYQEMRRSPDVTAAEAGRLFAHWLEEFAAERDRVERVHAMPAIPRKAGPSPFARDLDEAMRRLQL